MSKSELSDVAALSGLFVGQLSADELALFEKARSQGLARWSYEGAGGFLGLAMVRTTDLFATISQTSPANPARTD